MKFIYIIICIILLLLCYGFLENYRFIVTSYKIKSPKIPDDLSGKKCIVFSDLHNCEFGRGNKRLIEKIKQITPNFIIIAGDTVNGTVHSTKAISFLNYLSSNYTVISSNGNHELEQQLFYQDYYEEYCNSGIINLDNSIFKLTENCVISGLSIPIDYYKRIFRPDFSQDIITKNIGHCDKQCYNILVAHNPAYIADYAEEGYDLILCGHWHGGIIRLPLFGGVITPQLKFFPKYSGGHYKIKKHDVIVSRGLGSHTLKIRINNTPELIVLEFEKTGE